MYLSGSTRQLGESPSGKRQHTSEIAVESMATTDTRPEHIIAVSRFSDWSRVMPATLGKYRDFYAGRTGQLEARSSSH